MKMKFSAFELYPSYVEFMRRKLTYTDRSGANGEGCGSGGGSELRYGGLVKIVNGYQSYVGYVILSEPLFKYDTYYSRGFLASELLIEMYHR